MARISRIDSCPDGVPPKSPQSRPVSDRCDRGSFWAIGRIG
jgi:hypothetical protein